MRLWLTSFGIMIFLKKKKRKNFSRRWRVQILWYNWLENIYSYKLYLFIISAPTPTRNHVYATACYFSCMFCMRPTHISITIEGLFVRVRTIRHRSLPHISFAWKCPNFYWYWIISLCSLVIHSELPAPFVTKLVSIWLARIVNNLVSANHA